MQLMARKSRIPSALLDLMASEAHHAWTLQGLQTALRRRRVKADFSSVFRAIKKLVAQGAVQKFALDDGRVLFARCGEHHDHFHCTTCDALIPVPCVLSRRAFPAVEAHIGCTIAEHQVLLSGTCETCQAGTEH